MVTFVGTQPSFAEALKELVALDFDAIEAYKAAINRLSSQPYQEKLQEFKADHERHVHELSKVLVAHGEVPPTGPSTFKQWLTKGKVVIEQVMGDKGILSAMLSNEGDTNTAYEVMNDRTDKWPDAAPILKQGLADEQKHKAWLTVYANTD